MFTKSDKKFLKENFATKDDLVAMEKRQDATYAAKGDLQQLEKTLDQQIDKKLNPIKQSIKKIQNTLNLSIKLSENQHKQHFHRLLQIEEKLGIKKPDFVPSN